MRDVASNLAGAISDPKLGAIFDVGRGGGSIVFAVEVASNRPTLGARDPEVGAAGVKDDLEFLRGRSESDRTKVLLLVSDVQSITVGTYTGRSESSRQGLHEDPSGRWQCA